jgi:hypothetical protein
MGVLHLDLETAHVVALEGLHQPRQRARLAWCQQQMHVVAHQHIGMQPASEAQPCVALAWQVSLAILIVQKARQPVVSTLHHVLRNAGEIETWRSGYVRQHGSRVSPQRSAQAASQPYTKGQPSVGNCL